MLPVRYGTERYLAGYSYFPYFKSEAELEELGASTKIHAAENQIEINGSNVLADRGYDREKYFLKLII